MLKYSLKPIVLMEDSAKTHPWNGVLSPWDDDGLMIMGHNVAKCHKFKFFHARDIANKYDGNILFSKTFKLIKI